MSSKKETHGGPSSSKVKFIPQRGKETKKRKSDMIEVDDIERDPIQILKELGKRVIEISQQLSTDHISLRKNFDESESLRKSALARIADLEKKLAEDEKRLKDQGESHQKELSEVMEGAMKSAAIAILEAKIGMANDAEKEGLSIFSKDKDEWIVALVDLTGGDVVIPGEKDPAAETVAEARVMEQDVGVLVGDEGGSTNA